VTTYTDEESTDWSTYYRLSTQEHGERRSNALVKGTKGHRIWKELDGFLREGGIDTLLITGCLTDVCCESTARDGMMLNYRVVMVTDANAADTDADHNAALCAVYSTFGDVMPTDMVVGLLT
jgi:ureidoacrylate peracid hydrolase